MAKSRVKPLKDITLPRMELMGALIATRLANHVVDALRDTICFTEQVLWVDSQIVIHWITGNKKLPVFVQNRINEINKSTYKVKYCPSKDNPADLLTRGISATELKNSRLWWNGPTWLGQGDWPICELFDSPDPLQPETRSESPDVTQVNATDQPTNGSIAKS
ncbi:uncharacterized protein [Ptychodera flava]|uniref:uncharacterized protein n=1 Tax=Ptychodera flava TaxID=63121 RepID=UPI00396A76A1